MASKALLALAPALGLSLTLVDQIGSESVYSILGGLAPDGLRASRISESDVPERRFIVRDELVTDLDVQHLRHSDSFLGDRGLIPQPEDGVWF